MSRLIRLSARLCQKYGLPETKGKDGGYILVDAKAALAVLTAQGVTVPPVIVTGPGTELKKLLATVGITATANCSCNARARRMDVEESREPGWCEAHIDEIVGWLREEAEKRGLPFLDVAGRMLVRRAIRNARRAAAS